MALCSICKGIHVLDLPVFPGTRASKGESVLGAEESPVFPHHPSFESLKTSARSCDLCAHFIDEIGRIGEVGAQYLNGNSSIPLGQAEFTSTRPHPATENSPFGLRGLCRAGWTAEKRRLYGLQLVCGSITKELALCADNGL